MQAIKANRKKKSRDMDEKDKQHIAVQLIDRMTEAWREDKESIDEQRPALRKLNMLGTVERIMKQRSLHETLLDYNILEVVRNWLQPWPQTDEMGREVHLQKRFLPNVTIRTTLYESLSTMPIRPEHLKNSERDGPGLGKVILMLLKHPKETIKNKRFLQGMLEEWSRQIFKKTKDYRQLGSEIEVSTSAPRRKPAVVRQRSSESVEDFVSGTRDEEEGDATSTRVMVPQNDGCVGG